MNRDQGHHLPSIYGQIIPRPPSEPNHPGEGRSKRRNHLTLPVITRQCLRVLVNVFEHSAVSMSTGQCL